MTASDVHFFLGAVVFDLEFDFFLMALLCFKTCSFLVDCFVAFVGLVDGFFAVFFGAGFFLDPLGFALVGLETCLELFESLGLGFGAVDLEILRTTDLVDFEDLAGDFVETLGMDINMLMILDMWL